MGKEREVNLVKCLISQCKRNLSTVKKVQLPFSIKHESTFIRGVICYTSAYLSNKQLPPFLHQLQTGERPLPPHRPPHRGRKDPPENKMGCL